MCGAWKEEQKDVKRICSLSLRRAMVEGGEWGQCGKGPDRLVSILLYYLNDMEPLDIFHNSSKKIHIHTCPCIHIDIHTFIHIYTCEDIYTHHTYMDTHTCIHTFILCAPPYMEGVSVVLSGGTLSL